MVKHAPVKICPCLQLKLPPPHLHFPTRKKKKKQVVKSIKMKTYLEGAEALWLVNWTLGREVWDETWLGQCVAFLDKTIYSHSASQEYKWVLANYQGSRIKCWKGGGGHLTMD